MLNVNKMTNSLGVFEQENFDIESFNEANFDGTLETFTIFVPTDIMNLSRIQDDYDYDMETSHNIFFWDELLPTLIVYCLTFVLGLVGNVLIIFTIFRYRKMKSTTNVFLASLASSDLLLILFCIPVKGFSRFIPSDKSNLSKKSKNLKLNPSKNSAYHSVKTYLDTILIKGTQKHDQEEDEGDKIYLGHPVDDGFTSQSSSDSEIRTADTSLGTYNPSLFPSSKKLSVMESSLDSSDTNSKLGMLMSKLSEEIRKCSNYMKRFNELGKEKTFNYMSSSDSKISLKKTRDKNTIKWGGAEQVVCPVFIYSANGGPAHLTKIPSPKSLDTLKSKKMYPRETTLHESEAYAYDSNVSLSSHNSKASEKTIWPGKAHGKLEEFACCEDCNLLRMRILRLKRDLERIEKKMPLYPKEYQDSIKRCLESLNMTSETFLKRLKSCARLRYLDECRKYKKQRHPTSKRSCSAPGPVVHEFTSTNLNLRPSNSDYNLNVGMEITMENVDRVTGKRKGPELRRDVEQEGNVQCRVVKNNDTPVLVLDTDFSYNPISGMLFKNKEINSDKSRAECSTRKSKSSNLAKKRSSSCCRPECKSESSSKRSSKKAQPESFTKKPEKYYLALYRKVQRSLSAVDTKCNSNTIFQEHEDTALQPSAEEGWIRHDSKPLRDTQNTGQSGRSGEDWFTIQRSLICGRKFREPKSVRKSDNENTTYGQRAIHNQKHSHKCDNEEQTRGGRAIHEQKYVCEKVNEKSTHRRRSPHEKKYLCERDEKSTHGQQPYHEQKHICERENDDSTHGRYIHEQKFTCEHDDEKPTHGRHASRERKHSCERSREKQTSKRRVVHEQKYTCEIEPMHECEQDTQEQPHICERDAQGGKHIRNWFIQDSKNLSQPNTSDQSHVLIKDPNNCQKHEWERLAFQPHALSKPLSLEKVILLEKKDKKQEKSSQQERVFREKPPSRKQSTPEMTPVRERSPQKPKRCDERPPKELVCTCSNEELTPVRERSPKRLKCNRSCKKHSTKREESAPECRCSTEELMLNRGQSPNVLSPIRVESTDDQKLSKDAQETMRLCELELEKSAPIRCRGIHDLKEINEWVSKDVKRMCERLTRASSSSREHPTQEAKSLHERSISPLSARSSCEWKSICKQSAHDLTSLNEGNHIHEHHPMKSTPEHECYRKKQTPERECHHKKQTPERECHHKKQTPERECHHKKQTSERECHNKKQTSERECHHTKQPPERECHHTKQPPERECHHTKQPPERECNRKKQTPERECYRKKQTPERECHHKKQTPERECCPEKQSLEHERPEKQSLERERPEKQSLERERPEKQSLERERPEKQNLERERYPEKEIFKREHCSEKQIPERERCLEKQTLDREHYPEKQALERESYPQKLILEHERRPKEYTRECYFKKSAPERNPKEPLELLERDCYFEDITSKCSSQEPTPTRECYSQEPTPEREYSSQEPTLTRESFPQEPMLESEYSSQEPTSLRESCSQEPTPERECYPKQPMPNYSSQEPTPTREYYSQEPTLERGHNAQEPTSARERYLQEPTSTRERYLQEPTLESEYSSQEPISLRESCSQERTPERERYSKKPTLDRERGSKSKSDRECFSKKLAQERENFSENQTPERENCPEKQAPVRECSFQESAATPEWDVKKKQKREQNCSPSKSSEKIKLTIEEYSNGLARLKILEPSDEESPRLKKESKRKKKARQEKSGRSCADEDDTKSSKKRSSSRSRSRKSSSRESSKECKKKCPKKKCTCKSEESTENTYSDCKPESKDFKKFFCIKKKDKSGKNSQIPVRRKTTPNCADSKSETRSLKISETCLTMPTANPESASANSTQLAKLFSFTWTFGFFLCKLVHYMQSVSAICSVLTLTAMSLERYYAIVHPMKAQYICTISQARRIITATWISALLLAVPILFAQVHLRVGYKVEAYWCVRDWDNKAIWRAHELYMMLLILVVPTGVMAVAYTAICWEIWEVMQRRQDMTSGKGHGICRKTRLTRNSSNESFPSTFCSNHAKIDNKRRNRGLLKKELADDGTSVKQVIKMLVAVVVIYVICWGPMLIDNVLQAYGILSHIRIGWPKYMGTTFHLMAYFNSCINPIIYGFMSKNFRESFRKTLCCVGKKPKTANRSFSLSQTRNTSIRYAESSFGRNISIALPV